MKESNYNIKFKFDDKLVIYNTVARKYVVAEYSRKPYLDKLLSNLNKDTYDIDEGKILRKLIKNNIIFDSKFNEFEKITYLINKSKFQSETFVLTIVPTLDCNFKCVYCYENRKQLKMNDETAEDLISFVKSVSKNVKNIRVAWFGGEPMLEYNMIKKLSKNFQDICKQQGCSYSASMTTNGYLFSDEIIDELKDLGINKMQITIDGDEKSHNDKRMLKNNEGTFTKVLTNLIKIVDKNIETVLRINIDENNKKSIPKLLDMIPIEKRKNTCVAIMNLFQNKNKINQYNAYKAAIDKGFKFKTIENSYIKCEATLKNSIMVHPDNRVTACQTFAENGIFFGNIEKGGKLAISNTQEFFKVKNISALNSDSCKKCNRISMCLGGCPYKRYLDNDACSGNMIEGMSLEEVLQLHVYHDMKNEMIRDVNII